MSYSQFSVHPNLSWRFISLAQWTKISNNDTTIIETFLIFVFSGEHCVITVQTQTRNLCARGEQQELLPHALRQLSKLHRLHSAPHQTTMPLYHRLRLHAEMSRLSRDESIISVDRRVKLHAFTVEEICQPSDILTYVADVPHWCLYTSSSPLHLQIFYFVVAWNWEERWHLLPI